MRTVYQSSICLVLALCLTGRALAQDAKPASAQAADISVIAFASRDRARFTAPSSVVQIRLEVYNSTGKKVFDVEVRGGNVLDWHLQDGQAEPLADDTYLCVVTVKGLSGRLTQRIGSVTVANSATSVQGADGSQMTPQQQQAIGPLEENPSLNVLKGDEARTTTVIAHDGQDGQIIRGKGALSFRIGDFYSGKDREQMRLTPEGNVGIGITNPQARLEVDGMIRATQGIIFPDGSTQYSAASKTLGARSTAPDGAAGGKHKIKPEATGTGTSGMLAMWTDSSGTLGDSAMAQNNGFIGVGTTTPPAPLTVDSSANTLPAGSGSLFIQGNANKERIEMRSASGSGTGPAVQGRGYSGTIAFPMATQAGGNLMIIGGSGHNGNAGEGGIVTLNAATIKMKAEENWTPSANGAFISFETTPPGSSSSSRTERMRIAGNGNVGIGTGNPLAPLHVAGNLLLDNNSNPIVYTTSINRELNRYVQLINSPSFPSASGLKAGGILVADDYTFANPGKNNLIVKGNVGVGTTSPTAARLQVNDTNVGTAVYGNSTIATGVFGQASTALFGGVEGDNSAASGIGVIGKANAASSVGVYGQSDNGVGVNGVSANGFAMRADGNTYQLRDKSGWVKALVYLNRDGTMARCYNGLTGSSSGGCGFTIFRSGTGFYNL
jgi:hypothetical protein